MAYVGWLLSPMPPTAPLPNHTQATPTAGQLREAVSEMVIAFKNPVLRRKVSELQQLAFEEGSDRMEDIRSILLPKQLGILERLGMPGNDVGIAMLQNFIQRRVCEGDTELRRLCECLLEMIGFGGEMPASDHQDSIEEAFIEMDDHDHLSSYCGRDADIQDVLCDAPDDEDRDWVIAELRALKRPRGNISLGLLKVWMHFENFGLPLECMLRAEHHQYVALLQNPSAVELFMHVVENRPVVIRGAMDKESFPPLVDFADFDYLRQRCGRNTVKVKGDLFKDRDDRSLFCTDPVVEMPFAEYLSLVEEAENTGDPPAFYMGKNPLQKELPELIEDLEMSTGSPMQKFGDCLGLGKRDITMYFGCGRNSTAIHMDPSENLLLVIMGRKTYWLYPPWDADCLYPTKVPSYCNSAVPPFLDPNDLPEEVLNRWPLYQHTRPLKVELGPGDMLYLPIFWWHAVTGSVTRNMQVTHWCDMHPHKRTHCDPSWGARGLAEKLEKLLESG